MPVVGEATKGSPSNQAFVLLTIFFYHRHQMFTEVTFQLIQQTFRSLHIAIHVFVPFREYSWLEEQNISPRAMALDKRNLV